MKSVLRKIHLSKNTLLFWGLVWLSVSGGVLAFVNPADLPIVFAQTVTTGQFSDTLEYEDGTVSIQVHEEYILDFDGEWKAQRVFEDENKIVIESNSAPAIVFDKNACAYTLYDKGYIENENNPQIPSISWVTRTAELNTDNWVTLSELDNQQCVVELREEPKGWSIWATKELQGNAVTNEVINGELETTDDTIFLDGAERQLFPFEFDFDGNGVITEDEIIQDKIGWKFYSYGKEKEFVGTKLKQEQVLYYSNGVGIKESLKIFNNDPTLRNNKFAFTQTLHTDDVLTLGGQSFDIANLVGTVLDRNWILDNQAQIFEVTEKLSYDFSYGIEDIWAISFYENTDGYKIALDYANVGETITPIDAIYELDPTINITQSGGVYSFGALPAHAVVQSGSLDANPLTSQQITDIQTAIDSSGTYPATPNGGLYENGYVRSTNTYTYSTWSQTGSGAKTNPAVVGSPYVAGQNFAYNSGPTPASSFSIEPAHPIYNQPLTELTVPLISYYSCAGYYGYGAVSVPSGSSVFYINGNNYDTTKTFTVTGSNAKGVMGNSHLTGTSGNINCIDGDYNTGSPVAGHALNWSTMRMTFNPPIYLTTSDNQNIAYTDNHSQYYGYPWFYTFIPTSNGLNDINDPNSNGWCSYHWGGVVSQGSTNGGQYGNCSSNTQTDTGVWNYGTINKSYQEPLISAQWGTLTYPTLTLNYIVAVEPDAPENFALSYDKPNNIITLNWSAPLSDGGKPVTGYRVEVSNDGVNFGTATTTTGYTYSVGNLTFGQTYYYRVVAINDVGDSVYTSVLSQQIGDPPDPPTNVQTSIPNPNSNPFDITVSWSAPTNVGTGTLTGFEIDRDGSQIASVGLVTSYADTVSGIGTYTYTVRAVSNHGTSTDSSSSQISTPTEPDAPSLNLAINNPNSNPFDIEVSFVDGVSDGGSAVTNYNLYSSPDDITYTLVASGLSSPYTTTVSGIGTWYFKAESNNNAGTSALSSAYSIATPNAPDPPSNISLAINNPDPSPLTISVTITPPANNGGSTITGYNIYSSPDDITYTLELSNVSSPQDITVSSDGTWYFKAETVNNAGASALSSAYSIATPTVPDAPSLSLAINDPNGLPFDITATFNAPANDGGSAITNYELYYSSDDITYTKIATGVTTPQTYTVSSAGTHYFKAEVNNNVGVSALSSAYSIATPTVPDAPSLSLAINNPDPNPLDITVSFIEGVSNGGSSVTGYNLYSSPDNTTYTSIVNATSSPYTTTVSNSGTWYFKAESINNVGTSALSSAYSIATPTVPDAVTDLTYVTGTNTSLSVSWSAPNNGGSAITLYKMFVDGSQVDTTTSTSYTFTGLTTKTSYDLTVFATNNVGDSSVSNTVTETVWGVPDAVTNTSASSTLSTITITYDAAVPYGYPVTGYKLERESPVGGGFTVLSANIGNVTSYINTGLSPVTEYNYRITPLSSIGDGVSATISYTSLPPAPTGLTASSTITGNMDLSWTAPSPSTGVTGYHIQRADGVGNAYATIVADTGNTNTTYTDTGLTPGIVYVYRVAAITPYGESTYSNSYSMTTYHLPDAVTDLTVTTNNLLQFVLNWSQPTLYGTFTGYQLNYTTPTGIPQTIYSSSIQDTNAKISGFDPTIQFFFRVAPITIHGTNATGNIVNGTVTSAIEIGNINFLNSGESVDVREIVYSVTTVDDNTDVITATFDPALELNCEISQPALGTTQEYPSISETLDGANAYHDFTINNSNGQIVEILCYDTTDNEIQSQYILKTDEIGNNTTGSILSIQQIKDFTDGTLGGGDNVGGLNLIILAVGIVGMIGFNRTHPAIGIGMFVVVLGGARYFDLIGNIDGIIGIVAIGFVLAIAYRSRQT